jgi:lipid-A-disaccharide synthase
MEQHRGLYHFLHADVKIVFQQTYSLLANSYAAMVTSGTATLETLLFHVPQVVCYKGNYVSYLIAKNLIKGIAYISLVNLIASKEVVKELIQQDMNQDMLLHELQLILGETPHRRKMLEDYKQLQQHLGDGNTSASIAMRMYQLLQSKKD